MTELEKLAQKGNFTAIESVIYTYAILEKQGRGDGLAIASEKAAESLSTLQKRVEGLEKIKDIAKKIYDASERDGNYGDGSVALFLDDQYENSALLVKLGELLENVE